MKPRLLVDENIPMPSVAYLRDKGFDILSVTELSQSITDEGILKLAVTQERWILTFDHDFGELIFNQRHPSPPAIILLRLNTYRPIDPGYLVEQAITEDINLSGYFVVLETDKLRKRKMQE